MNGDGQTITFLEWAIGLLITALLACVPGFWALYSQLSDRIEAVATEGQERSDMTRKIAMDDDQKLWKDHKDHVDRTQTFKERTLEIMGRMATNESVSTLIRDSENRIMGAISRHNGNGNGNGR